jgi:hypothetical protein
LLAKVGVESSNLFARSKFPQTISKKSAAQNWAAGGERTPADSLPGLIRPTR